NGDFMIRSSPNEHEVLRTAVLYLGLPGAISSTSSSRRRSENVTVWRAGSHTDFKEEGRDRDRNRAALHHVPWGMLRGRRPGRAAKAAGQLGGLGADLAALRAAAA